MTKLRLVAVLLTSLVTSLPAPAAHACGTAGSGEAVTLAAVGDRLILELTDGRLVRLAGLDPADGTPDTPDLADLGRTALRAIVGQHTLRMNALADRPDRWDRLPASIEMEDGRDLTEAAIAAGLGRYAPDVSVHACRATLLAAEDEARGRKTGLWADPFYAILAPGDLGSLAERSATTVVAQGRRESVETTPFRTTLRFTMADDIAVDRSLAARDILAAVIAPRLMKRIGAAGLDLPSAVGSIVRVRGLLDLRFGPRVELTEPDAVEIVAQTGQTAGKDATSAH